MKRTKEAHASLVEEWRRQFREENPARIVDRAWLYAGKAQGDSVQDRVYTLRQNAVRSLPGLREIEDSVASGDSDFPHFTAWLTDFVQLARAARVPGLPAIWEWEPPGVADVGAVRRVVELLAVEAERTLPLVRESAPSTKPPSDPLAPLSKPAKAVLDYLVRCDMLQGLRDIAENLEEDVKAVKQAVDELIGLGLAERPRGRRRGVGLTASGRSRASTK